MKKNKSLIKKENGEIKKIGNTKWTIELIDKTNKIATTEDLANTMIQTSHQFNLVTQSILQQKFGFDDKDLKDFNKELSHALEGLAFFEDKGLHPMSLHSLNQVVDVSLNNYQVLRAARAGLELPTDKEANKLLMGKSK